MSVCAKHVTAVQYRLIPWVVCVIDHRSRGHYGITTSCLILSLLICLRLSIDHTFALLITPPVNQLFLLLRIIIITNTIPPIQPSHLSACVSICLVEFLYGSVFWKAIFLIAFCVWCRVYRILQTKWIFGVPDYVRSFQWEKGRLARCSKQELSKVLHWNERNAGEVRQEA